jgi:PKD repeat protein
MLVLAFNIEFVKADGSWVWVRNTVTGRWGEAVVGTGSDIYIARKSSFYRYRPADDSWVEMAAPPNPDPEDAFKTGTTLAWDFGDYIYALYGAATPDSRRWFYRYSISSNSWVTLANTTADQGEGDAMTWVDTDNCIYATIGGEQRLTYFVRYDPATNSWDNTPADPPAGMGDGASLVWTGGNFLYALRGEFDEGTPLDDFWRYSLTEDVWTTMDNIPAYPYDGGVGGVGDGGSLIYAGLWLPDYADYIFALSGNQVNEIPDNRTYRYTISMNSWERLADLPFKVGYYVGCRLGYANGYIYAWEGAPSTWTGGGDDLAKYELPPAPVEGTAVGGYISENTTWTLDGSPYIVVEDAIVESGVTLAVEPGVVMKFASGRNIIIDGIFVADGNETHRITFTSNSSTPAIGDWGGIRFRMSSISELCLINWAVVEYADKAVRIERSSLRIENSIIRDNDYGIFVTWGEASIIVSNSLIFNNTWGVYSEEINTGIRAEVSDSTISNNEYGISMNILTMVRSNVSKNTELGIGGKYLSIHESMISENEGPGVFCYYGTTTITYSTITDNRQNGVIANQYAYGPMTAIHYCQIYNNTPYDIYNEYSADVNARNNWWGTTNESLITEHIYDYYDDYNLGKVIFEPYLIPPVACFSYYPAIPYQYGTVTFDATDSFNPYGSITDYAWNFGDGNATTTTSTTINHIYETLGTYNVSLTVTDEFGLTNSTMKSLMVFQDNLAPVTIDNYSDAWHNADFTITLTATDLESGVAETYYRINGEFTKRLSVDGQPHITTESANNTLEYWSMDNAGNEELPHKILTEIKLDKIAPMIDIPSRIPDSDVQPDQEVRVSVNVTDSVSEVKNVTICYTINNGSTWENHPMSINLSTGLYEATIPGQLADTWVKYKIIAYDYAGNQATKDGTEPSCTYQVIPEFPTMIILPLFMVLCLITVALGERKKSLKKIKE